MTRTKNRVFIVAPETRPSKFILELQEKYKNVSIEGQLNPKTKFTNSKMCPICGYPLQLRFNKNYGLKLYMCTNEPEICEYMTNDFHGGKVSICKCDKCKDGFLIVKQSKTNNYFLGCTNYKTINCTRQMSFQEYFETHNIPLEPINIDYNVKVEGTKNEEFQSININTYEPKPKLEKKVVDISLYQTFYDELLAYRNNQATSDKARFYVFPEETIYQIWLTKPLTITDLANIKGVGEVKLEKYGNDIIAIVNKYLELSPNKNIVINRCKDKNDSTGQKWTVEEEKQLLEEFSQGMKISEIAKLHSRNPGGIRARLKKLGVIE